jgi:hypothetical protein
VAGMPVVVCRVLCVKYTGQYTGRPRHSGGGMRDSCISIQSCSKMLDARGEVRGCQRNYGPYGPRLCRILQVNIREFHFQALG